MGVIVSLADPELVRQVFTGDPAIFHAGEASNPVLGPTVGANSMLTLDEDAHLRQRKLLLAPFHGPNVGRWEDTIRAIAEQDLDGWPVGRPFALHDHTRAITLEVILRAVFGVLTRRDLGPLSPWARFKRAREALDVFLHEEIARRRSAPDLAERDDVLSLLLCASDEAGQPLSGQELRDELVTVLGAGHETTATAVAWAFERLLRTPSVLERLVRSLPEDDEYLEAVVKETLRMRPAVTDVGRRLTGDIELAGYRIPAGALVMPAITTIHFRSDLYPDPDGFRPERFLGRTPEPYTWIPFGGGVRRCIGASFAQFEMRVIIRTILERVQLRAVSPRGERSKLRNVTAAPARGCRVVVEHFRQWPSPSVPKSLAISRS